MHNHADVSAKDYVNFTNVFQLKNIFSREKISGCSKIKCNQIVKFENKKAEQIPFEKYVHDYENDADIYFINKNGEEVDKFTKKTKFLHVLKSGGLKLLDNLLMGINCKLPERKWHNGRVFLMKLYPNKIRVPGFNDYYLNMPNSEKVKFIMRTDHKHDEIYLPEGTIVKFKLFDMTGNCTHSHLKKHINSFNEDDSSLPIMRKSRRSKRRSKSRKRKFSKPKNTRRRKSKTRKSKPISQVTIIGSTQCMHCGTQIKKLKN